MGLSYPSKTRADLASQSSRSGRRLRQSGCRVRDKAVRCWRQRIEPMPCRVTPVGVETALSPDFKGQSGRGVTTAEGSGPPPAPAWAQDCCWSGALPRSRSSGQQPLSARRSSRTGQSRLGGHSGKPLSGLTVSGRNPAGQPRYASGNCPPASGTVPLRIVLNVSRRRTPRPRGAKSWPQRRDAMERARNPYRDRHRRLRRRRDHDRIHVCHRIAR